MESQDEPNVTCENCQKLIPESKSFLHEAYCFRNVIRCPKCNEPINKSEVEQHEQDVHTLKSCEFCHKHFEANQLKLHTGVCTEKPVLCQFCNTEVSKQEFNEHAYQCGSRTRKCEYCNNSILVRDLEDHEAVCQVQQMTRPQDDEETHYKADDPFQDLLEKHSRKFGYPDSKGISKRRVDVPKKQEVPKKKLTKLSESNNPAFSRGKTQEEIDEELARELNKEFYEGRGGRGGEKTQAEIDDEINREMERNAGLSKKASYGSKYDESAEERAKAVDEEFFGFKKGGRRKMDIENANKVEEDADEAYARMLQEEFERGETDHRSTANKPSSNKGRNASKPVSYYEPPYEPDYSNEYEYHGPNQGQQNDQIDPELQQYLNENEHEDAELQKAIQASLQGYK